MSQTANRIVKNTFWLYGQMGLSVFVSLFTTRLILAGLGAADFGIYNVVGGAIAMLGFFNAAMAGATQRFMSYSEGEGNPEKKVIVFNVSVSLHIVISIIVTVVLLLLGYYLFNGILNIPLNRMFASKIVYGSLIISTVFSVIGVPYEAVLNSHENMRIYAYVGILESFLKLMVAYACVCSSYDKLVVYGILMTSIPFIKLTVLHIYCYGRYNECTYKPKQYFNKVVAKEMCSFAGWNLLTSFSSIITMQGITILINMFGGIVVNAAHAVANQLAGQLMAFSNTMLKALTPVLVKSKGAGDNTQMLEVASSGNKLSFLVYTFFAIPFIIEAPYILTIWLKDPPEWSVLFVRLVLIRQMISQLSVTLVTCINATGYIKSYSLVESFFWMLALVLGFLLYKFGAPIYTIYVILIGLAVVRTVIAVVYCMNLCQLKAMRYLKDTILPCVLQMVLHVCILGAVICVMKTSFIRLLVVIIISVITHLSLAFFIAFNSKERSMLGRMLMRIKTKFII